MSNATNYHGKLHAAKVAQSGNKITIVLHFINENFEAFKSELTISDYMGDTPEQFASSLRYLADSLEFDAKNTPINGKI
jgi:hypothetical protein